MSEIIKVIAIDQSRFGWWCAATKRDNATHNEIINTEYTGHGYQIITSDPQTLAIRKRGHVITDIRFSGFANDISIYISATKIWSSKCLGAVTCNTAIFIGGGSATLTHPITIEFTPMNIDTIFNEIDKNPALAELYANNPSTDAIILEYEYTFLTDEFIAELTEKQPPLCLTDSNNITHGRIGEIKKEYKEWFTKLRQAVVVP